MKTYKVLRCPYCGYIWIKRKENLPVSCPRCKKRFDYPENPKTLEEEEITSDCISDFLEEAKRALSYQSKSLAEIMEKMED